MNKVVKMLLVVCLTGGMLAGCHTLSGAGQDISASGHAITRAAD